MAVNSSYTVKQLVNQFESLESRARFFAGLPSDDGELAEDPTIHLAAAVPIDRAKLAKWPDVARFIALCTEAKLPVDSEGASQFIAQTCLDQSLDLNNIGALPVSKFVDMAVAWRGGKSVDNAERSRLMTKREAAFKFGCPSGHGNPQQWLDRQIAKGEIHEPKGSGQQLAFVLSDFPEAVRESVRQKVS